MVGIHPRAIGEDSRRVVGIAMLPIDEPDDGDEAEGVAGEFGNGIAGCLAEGAAQHQVFRWVARDRKFGERDQLAAIAPGFFDARLDERDVPIDIAHGGVDLGEPEPHGPHGKSIAGDGS